MPRINQYTREILPRGFQNINTPQGAFGGDTMSGLASGVDKVRARLDEIQTKRDKSEYINKLTAFELENMKRAQQLSEEDFEGEAFDVYAQDYQSRAAEFEQMVPETMRDQWQMDNSRLYQGYVQTGFKEQVRRAAVKAKMDFENTKQTISNMAYEMADPSAWPELFDRADQIASTLPGSGIDKKSVAEGLYDDIRRQTAESLARQNPYEFVSQYKDGVFRDTPDSGYYKEIADREIESQKKAAAKEKDKVAEAIQKGFEIDGNTNQLKDPAVSAAMIMQQNGIDVTEGAGWLGYNQRYIDDIVSTQLESGAKEGQVRLLPEENRKRIAANLSTINDLDEFDNAVSEVIAGVPEKYQNALINEIMTEPRITTDLRIYSQTDPAKHGQLRKAIFEMRSPERKKEIESFYKERTDETERSGIEDSINKKLNDFYAANKIAAGDLEAMSQVYNSVRDLAQYEYINNGGDDKEAVNFATSWLFDKIDVVNAGNDGSYVLPKNYNFSARDIEVKSRFLKQESVTNMREKMDVEFPAYASTEQLKTKYIDDIGDSAQWVNNEDNSGIVLMLYGDPVLRSNGERYEYKFGLVNALDIGDIKRGRIKKYKDSLGKYDVQLK